MNTSSHNRLNIPGVFLPFSWGMLLVFFWLLASGFTVVGAPSWKVEQAPAEAVAAAEAGLPRFLALIPTETRHLYGFTANTEMTKLRLGRPIVLHTLSPEALSNNQVALNVGTTVTETTMWFFPVLTGSEIKAMLVVDRQTNTWQAVSLGYAHLAGEWAKVTQQWPEQRGYSPRLIACFQAKRHYFAIPEAGESNLTPIASRTGKRPRDPASPSNTAGQAKQYATLGSFTNEVSQLKSHLSKVDKESALFPSKEKK